MKRLISSVALLLCLATTLLGQNISVTVSRGGGNALDSILPSIERQAGVVFSYDKDILAVKTSVTGQAEGSLSNVLDSILSGTGVSWERRDGNLILLYKVKSAPAKPVQVSGRVTDSNGEPVPGAAVMGEGGAAVITDLDGNYSISVPAGSSLSFECLGFDTVSKKAAAGKMDVALQESFNELDQSVVVGYRTVKKASLVGAVTTVDIKAKEKEPISNSSQMFYSTPGIYVNQTGSQPGKDGATIQIRGVNSMNSTGGSPLVLLDGVEYDINEIDPSTIESISVLKDVSAAIYGLKAANGVILITSKRGVKGRPRVEYNGKFGIQQATYLPDVVTDPIVYMRMRNTAEINSGVSPSAVTYKESQIREYEAGLGTDPSVYAASDWFDICLENGYINQHSVRLSGGTDAVSYAIGLGYTGQKGVFIENDNAQRYAMDLKLDARVTPKFKLSGSFQGNIREFKEVGYTTGTVLRVIMRGLPIFSDYHSENVYGSSWIATPGRNKPENPRMHVEQGYIYRNYQELLTAIGAEWQIIPGLTYIANGSYRRFDHFSKDYLPQMYTANPKTGDVIEYTSNTPRVTDYDNYMNQLTFSHRLVFDRDFGKHNLHAMIGQDWQNYYTHSFTAKSQGMFNDNTLMEFNALADKITNSSVTGSATQKRMISYFGRLAYNYADRYLVEATLRYDGSSNLSAKNRWQAFPSVMIAWNINNESFFKASWVDMLKLRASWGIMGSESVSPYSYQMLYKSAGSYSFGGTLAGGYATTALTDINLGWEKTRSLNAGVDLSAFKGALTVEADVFEKYTYDILMTRSIPSYIGGLSGPKSNVGAVSNKGFELAASWKGNVGPVHYGVNGSVSYVKNKVEYQPFGPQYPSKSIITTEGYPIRSYYVYEANGYFQSYEEIENATAVYGSKDKLRPGYIKYVNQNDDGIINEDDKIITKNSIPEWTYSFGLNIGWKGLNLSAQFQGVGDVYTMPFVPGNLDTGSNILVLPFHNGAGVTWDWAYDSWTPDNRNSKLPILTTHNNAPENFIGSTFWLQNAAYLRLKNLQLSYTIPEKLLSKIRIASAQVYISGQNLWTLSDFTLYDPEINLSGNNIQQYPNLKTYSVGVNIGF